MATQLQKAYILNNDTDDQVPCLFNPPDYTFTKANTYSSTPVTGANVTPPHFGGGGNLKMTFELFFDTYVGAEGDMEDVRTYTDALLELMAIEPSTVSADSNAKKGRPPICTFHWGTSWSFKGVIDNITLKFTLFTSAGKPVRATASMSMLQVKDEDDQPAQNPTSGGEGVRATHTVDWGETLDLIAFRQYGDATKWRPIALANDMDDPRSLRPGQKLVVPDI
jgi:nucleoid-associated protein YgaU